MYFKNRQESGQKLTAELQHLRYENCVILALGDGAVVVGEQIAVSLHAVLTMLVTEEIEIPGEQMAFGTVDQEGGFLHNQSFSEGEFDYYYGEFRGYLDEQKRVKFERINRLLGDGGVLDKAILWDQTIVLVSDGMQDGTALGAAMNFLKPVRTNRVVVATPLASASAVDRMHALCDEIHVLKVLDNFLDTDHYYDDNTVPPHEETIRKLNQAILNWR